MSTQPSTNTKFITNINWDLDPNGIRKLEIDALSSFNSINLGQNIGSNGYYFSITGAGSNTPTLTGNGSLYSPFLLVRKRGLLLIDIWNRILNSGLFKTILYEGNTRVDSTVFLGSGLRSLPVEFFFKNTLNEVGLTNRSTIFIITKIFKFLKANIDNYNNSLIDAGPNYTNTTYFNISYVNVLQSSINPLFKPNDKFLNLLEELLDLAKEVLDEQKLATNYFVNFLDLTMKTESGRTKVAELFDINLQLVFKEHSYMVEYEAKIIAAGGKPLSETEKRSWVLDFFGGFIIRNANSEAWSIKNVLIETNPTMLQTSGQNFEEGELETLYTPNYIACSQLDMKKPLVITGGNKYIDWDNEMDHPYILNYNGFASIYIPDEIKDPELADIIPDNQLNLCCSFWKISHTNKDHQTYDKKADVKLNFDPDNMNKLDYFDNLTLYLKLN